MLSHFSLKEWQIKEQFFVTKCDEIYSRNKWELRLLIWHNFLKTNQKGFCNFRSGFLLRTLSVQLTEPWKIFNSELSNGLIKLFSELEHFCDTSQKETPQYANCRIRRRWKLKYLFKSFLSLYLSFSMYGDVINSFVFTVAFECSSA